MAAARFYVMYMSADNTAEQVSLIGAELARRTEQLGAAVAAAVRTEIDFYEHAEVVSNDELVESCTANVRFIFSGLAGPQSFDTTPATATGETRAQSRVPLPVVMAAYRIGSHLIWQALLDIVEQRVADLRDVLLELADHPGGEPAVHECTLAGVLGLATAALAFDEWAREMPTTV